VKKEKKRREETSTNRPRFRVGEGSGAEVRRRHCGGEDAPNRPDCAQPLLRGLGKANEKKERLMEETKAMYNEAQNWGKSKKDKEELRAQVWMRAGKNTTRQSQVVKNETKEEQRGTWAKGFFK